MGSSLVLWADAQVTFHLYAMSPLKDKLEVVRKNIRVDPHNEETLLWTKALAGARGTAIPAEGMRFGLLPPRRSSTVTKKAFTGHSALSVFLTL